MHSPFPGMDPYLETPDLWPDVHHQLISKIQEALNPIIRPHYVARVELRVYISDEDDPGRPVIIPDLRVEASKTKGLKTSSVHSNGGLAIAEPILLPYLLDDEMKEARLEIRHRESGTLVTIIEILSPTNKIRGSEGRKSFMKKRRETLLSDVHWVEIDLLRDGLASVPRKRVTNCDYRVLVSRNKQRGSMSLWPISIREALPVIGIPLRGPDSDVPLDLNAILVSAYDSGAYDLSIDYRDEADPLLKGADKNWAAKLLRERGLR